MAVSTGPTAPSAFYSYPAELIEVHDGDTARWKLDRGFEDSKRMWLRFAGYDAAEMKDGTRGEQAKAALVKLLETTAARPGFKTWVVQSVRTGTGVEVLTYARYLGYLFAAFDEKGGIRFEPMNSVIYDTLKAADLLKRGSKWNPPA